MAGGGDSALDWTIYLVKNKIVSELSLVHRRSSFRGHLDSVQQVMDLADAGKIKLITNAEVTALEGGGKLENVVISITDENDQKTEIISVACDHFVPLFGLKPSLGPIADWGLEIEKGAIVVNTKDYSTNRAGIFAIGDVNTYEGKLKLILCGFHEGTMAVQSAFARIHPEKKNVLKYTTVNGVTGF